MQHLHIVSATARYVTVDQSSDKVWHCDNSIDGFHSIFHRHRNWRANRSCDAISKQHSDVIPSSCHSENILWNPSIGKALFLIVTVENVTSSVSKRHIGTFGFLGREGIHKDVTW